jgi:hypothetical protein
MTEPKIRVVCSHCAAVLNLTANSTKPKFTCAKCGETTTKQLGIALARNTAPAQPSPELKSMSNDLKSIRIIVGIFGAVAGLFLMSWGGAFNACSHHEPPRPTVHEYQP